jgi:hypothetical protein
MAGALLFYDVFLEETRAPKLDPDYVAGITSPNFQDNRCRNLFAGILIRGIRDLLGRSRHHRDSAAEWLGSDNNHVSSFRHVCAILDLDVQKVRDKITTHKERIHAGLPGTIKMPYLQR